MGPEEAMPEQFVPPLCDAHVPRAQAFKGELYLSCCLCGRALDGKTLPVRFWSESFAGLINAARYGDDNGPE